MPEKKSPHAERTGQTGLSYEEAREELATVVQRLEAGGTTLEETLALWERGELLAKECQGWLDGARRRLEAASASDRASESGGDSVED